MIEEKTVVVPMVVGVTEEATTERYTRKIVGSVRCV